MVSVSTAVDSDGGSSKLDVIVVDLGQVIEVGSLDCRCSVSEARENFVDGCNDQTATIATTVLDVGADTKIIELRNEEKSQW
jgi:hypothetical protein